MMPLFVAEIGLNHEGSLDLALEMIRRATKAGAEIVKFQFGWRSGRGEINALALEEAQTLRSFCDQMGVEMMASIFNGDGFAVAKEVGLERYKIASRTVVDDPQLCESILSEGRETFISLGMWEGSEWPFGPPDEQRVRYLYCRSKYPTMPHDLHDMPSSFAASSYFGYSDHSLGIGACLVAIARGARLIEKHFTLNKSSTSIRDHVLSATPDEFATLTSVGRETSVVANRIHSEG